MNSPSENISPNATRAGRHNHDHIPHVYVVCWPELGIVKIGISTTVRWEKWHSRGAVTVATKDACCASHARSIESWMLKRLSRFGARAFASEQDARFALGKQRGGYTECYRLVQSPLFGAPPEHVFDYERAYGLILPRDTRDDLEHYHFARHVVTDAWRS